MGVPQSPRTVAYNAIYGHRRTSVPRNEAECLRREILEYVRPLCHPVIPTGIVPVPILFLYASYVVFPQTHTILGHVKKNICTGFVPGTKIPPGKFQLGRAALEDRLYLFAALLHLHHFHTCWRPLALALPSPPSPSRGVREVLLLCLKSFLALDKNKGSLWEPLEEGLDGLSCPREKGMVFVLPPTSLLLWLLSTKGYLASLSLSVSNFLSRGTE